jgi:transketolase
MEGKVFDKERLTEDETSAFRELSRLAKGDIVTMTRLAGSGHPGGSISSLDVYLVLFSYANLSGAARDSIIVSHGHTSPGLYATLARLGHLPPDEVTAFFRKAGTPFEGHVVKGIPFIDWSTGNLGQGLSTGCGFALASRMRGEETHVYVLMGDGEQQKGQIGEARRFAMKYGLSNVTVIIDYNGLQISGPIGDVMPQNIIENYLSDGWDVVEIDGHDYGEIYGALKKTRTNGSPTCIVANTLMGKGIGFMENKEKYHGSPLNDKEYAEAIRILGLEDNYEFCKEKRKGVCTWKAVPREYPVAIDGGEPFTYVQEDKIDNRTAFGRALKDIGEKNIGRGQPVCAFDCDLASSVKTGDFAKAFPDYFFQGGIQEHNTATMAGAVSTRGVVAFFADFGVFGIDETYNQQRLNDINRTNLKLILTHVGLDVGPDGKTHQCIDYIGLVNNLYNFGAIVPCDPNQTDRAIRYVAGTKGNFLVGMGRNRWPVTYGREGNPFFGGSYSFVYGRMDRIKEGEDGAVITYGGLVHRALKTAEILASKGVNLAVINMPCVKVIDEEMMGELIKLRCIFTYEDHNVYTGIGPRVAAYLLKHGYRGRLESFGVTRYGVSGDTEEALASEGLDAESMAEKLFRAMSKRG